MDHYYTLLIPLVLLGSFWILRSRLAEALGGSLAHENRGFAHYISNGPWNSVWVGVLFSLSSFSRSRARLMICGFVNSGAIFSRQAQNLLIGSSLGGALLLWPYLLYGLEGGLASASLGLGGLLLFSKSRYRAHFLSLFYFGLLLIILYYLLHPTIVSEFFSPLTPPWLLIPTTFFLVWFLNSEQVGGIFAAGALASGGLSAHNCISGPVCPTPWNPVSPALEGQKGSSVHLEGSLLSLPLLPAGLWLCGPLVFHWNFPALSG